MCPFFGSNWCVWTKDTSFLSNQEVIFIFTTVAYLWFDPPISAKTSMDPSSMVWRWTIVTLVWFKSTILNQRYIIFLKQKMLFHSVATGVALDQIDQFEPNQAQNRHHTYYVWLLFTLFGSNQSLWGKVILLTLRWNISVKNSVIWVQINWFEPNKVQDGSQW